MFRALICLCWLFLSIQLMGQKEMVSVGLYRASSISELTLELDANSSLELQKGLQIQGNYQHPLFRIVAKGNKMDVYLSKTLLGDFTQLVCRSTPSNSVVLKPTKPDYKGNRYTGNLIITSEKGVLKMINRLDENDYLVGVLRGEVGYDKALALYQVHAILSRTYERYYQWRHKADGFEVCDQTHCQVFKGYFDYKPYHIAVKTTDNIVVRDSATGELAELLFHSNCGGQTNASEDVWKSTLSYCRSVDDTFCLSSQNAFWEKKISLEKFCNKLNITLPVDSLQHAELCSSICSFSNDRPHDMELMGKHFRMIDLRSRLDLKSAWFDWECRDEFVYIYGKGFGHGVGLCQEGAIRMAALGYSPEDIIHHYFTSVKLTGIPLLPREISPTYK